jgi:hypothetical protein
MYILHVLSYLFTTRTMPTRCRRRETKKFVLVKLKYSLTADILNLLTITYCHQSYNSQIVVGLYNSWYVLFLTFYNYILSSIFIIQTVYLQKKTCLYKVSSVFTIQCKYIFRFFPIVYAKYKGLSDQPCCAPCIRLGTFFFLDILILSYNSWYSLLLNRMIIIFWHS